MVRMEPESKGRMDTLKMPVRHLFDQALEPFKKACDNDRDDHDYFRQLTLSSGVLEMGAGRVTEHLMPKINYSRQRQRIMGKLLEEVNQEGLPLPEGTGRKLRFRSGHKAELELTMRPSSGPLEATL